MDAEHARRMLVKAETNTLRPVRYSRIPRSRFLPGAVALVVALLAALARSLRV